VLHRAADACHHLRQRREVGRVVFGDEHVEVLGRQPVAACVRGYRRLVDHNEARDRLLLEPLAGIARGDAGFTRKFQWCNGAPCRERRVQPQLLPEINAVQLQRVNRGLQHPRCERLFGHRIRGGGNYLWQRRGRRVWLRRQREWGSLS
jgi:hypothetical protein